jgi:hypothetical protein
MVQSLARKKSWCACYSLNWTLIRGVLEATLLDLIRTLHCFEDDPDRGTTNKISRLSS